MSGGPGRITTTLRPLPDMSFQSSVIAHNHGPQGRSEGHAIVQMRKLGQEELSPDTWGWGQA
jgi:hypothetical protein